MNTSDRKKKNYIKRTKTKLLTYSKTNETFNICRLSNQDCIINDNKRPSKQSFWDVLQSLQRFIFFVFQNIFKTWLLLENVLNTSWKIKNCYTEDFFKTSWKTKNVCLLGKFCIRAKLAKIYNNMLKLNQNWSLKL